MARNAIIVFLVGTGVGLAAHGLETYGIDWRLSLGVGLCLVAAVYARVTA